MKKLYRKKKVFWYSVAGILILALIILSMITGKIVEWLWMSQLGYVSIFWRILSIKLLLFGLALVIVFLYFWINLRLVLPAGLKAVGTRASFSEEEEIGGIALKRRYLGITTALVSFVPALIFGFIFYSQWDTYVRFLWGGSYGEVDPLFGLDIGFYLFRLPFYELIQNSLLGLALVTFLMISLIYGSLGFLQWRKGMAFLRRLKGGRFTFIETACSTMTLTVWKLELECGLWQEKGKRGYKQLPYRLLTSPAYAFQRLKNPRSSPL